MIIRNKRQSRLLDSKTKFLIQYRNAILPTKFSLHQVQTFAAFTKSQIDNLEDSYISKQSLRNIIKNGIGLDYFFVVLEQILQGYKHEINSRYSVQIILKILLNGQFYRHLDRQKMVNEFLKSRNMQINVKAIIASILTYCARKLQINEIIRYMNVFQLEQRLNGTAPKGIFFQPIKISKILYKIGRKFKPNDLKNWFQDLKQIGSIQSKYIECYHFIYLSSLAIKDDSQIQNVLFLRDGKQNKQDGYNKQDAFQDVTKKLSPSPKNSNPDKKIIGLSLIQKRKSKTFIQISFKKIKGSLLAQQKSSNLLINNLRTRLFSQTAFGYNIFCIDNIEKFQKLPKIHQRNMSKCNIWFQSLEKNKKDKKLKLNKKNKQKDKLNNQLNEFNKKKKKKVNFQINKNQLQKQQIELLKHNYINQQQIVQKY